MFRSYLALCPLSAFERFELELERVPNDSRSLK